MKPDDESQIEADLAAIDAADAAESNPFLATRNHALVMRGRELKRAMVEKPEDPHVIELAAARVHHDERNRRARAEDRRRFREIQNQNPFAAASLAAEAGFPDHFYKDDDGPEAA